MWKYAHKLCRELPEKNPLPDHLKKYIQTGKAIWDHVRNRLVQRLLEYLEDLAHKDGIAYAKNQDQEKCIETIQLSVLDAWDPTKSKDDAQNWHDYLKKVLKYIRLPQKEEKDWRKLATQDVEARWKTTV